MGKFLFSMIFLFGILHVHASSWEDIDKYGEMSVFDDEATSGLKGEREAFIKAFLEAYKNYSPEVLGLVTDKEHFLEDLFNDFQKELSDGMTKIVTVKKQGQVIGFVGFNTTETPHQIYISKMAIDPSYWNRGIGRQLVFSILKTFPDTDHFLLVTRRINTVARRFWESLGFTESPYMHEGHNPLHYIGYELAIQR